MRKRTLLALSVAGLALASPSPSRADAFKSDSQANLGRIDLSGAYFRGTQLVGYGSRAGYQGGSGAIDLDLVYFPVHPVGVEASMRYSLATTQAAEPAYGADVAVDVAPIRWAGAHPGAVLFGAGGGGDIGKSSRLGDPGRVYPMLLARARIWPSELTSVHALYRFVPVTTNTLDVSGHHIELAVGVDMVQFGSRLDLSRAVGGDPSRTFDETKIGFFFGAAIY